MVDRRLTANGGALADNPLPRRLWFFGGATPTSPLPPPPCLSFSPGTNPFEGSPPRAICSGSIILTLLSSRPPTPPPASPPPCHSAAALGVERWQTRSLFGSARDANLIRPHSDANRADLAPRRWRILGAADTMAVIFTPPVRLESKYNPLSW